MKCEAYLRLLFWAFILNCNALLGQSISGIVINEKSGLPIEYVNIGIAGKSIGTVSDFSGNYTIAIDSQYDGDSLLFSCIGYQPFSVCITDLRIGNSKKIFLKEKVYEIQEIVVKPKIYKPKTLGITSNFKGVSAGFKDNLLGYELGMLMKNKKSAKIKRVTINIASCSYDSIFYRLNIYEVRGKMSFENILAQPIYIHESKEKVQEVIQVDLQSQGILVDGNFLVTLEHVRNLGEGYLYFCAGIKNKTYYRKTSQGVWKTAPVGISISVEADVEK